MRNTGTTYLSTDKKPKVLEELRDLLPPLPAEQFVSLEKEIIAHGCYSPVIVDEEMNIVDGHHRHKICEEHTCDTCKSSADTYRQNEKPKGAGSGILQGEHR